jgi:vacuolar-type H+-ATPase subunit E/Vma4
VSRREAGLAAAVEPVRSALLATALSDADAVRARARGEADAVVVAAEAQAAQLTAEARRQGGAEATAAAAAATAAARRQAHRAVLAARARAYRTLREQARVAVAGMAAEPGYTALRQRLTAAVHRILGPDARVRDSGDGGLVGEAGTRRVDLSLAGFADRAVDAVAAQEEQA